MQVESFNEKVTLFHYIPCHTYVPCEISWVTKMTHVITNKALFVVH